MLILPNDSDHGAQALTVSATREALEVIQVNIGQRSADEVLSEHFIKIPAFRSICNLKRPKVENTGLVIQ